MEEEEHRRNRHASLLRHLLDLKEEQPFEARGHRRVVRIQDALLAVHCRDYGRSDLAGYGTRVGRRHNGHTARKTTAVCAQAPMLNGIHRVCFQTGEP